MSSLACHKAHHYRRVYLEFCSFPLTLTYFQKFCGSLRNSPVIVLKYSSRSFAVRILTLALVLLNNCKLSVLPNNTLCLFYFSFFLIISTNWLLNQRGNYRFLVKRFYLGKRLSISNFHRTANINVGIINVGDFQIKIPFKFKQPFIQGGVIGPPKAASVPLMAYWETCLPYHSNIQRYGQRWMSRIFPNL